MLFLFTLAFWLARLQSAPGRHGARFAFNIKYLPIVAIALFPAAPGGWPPRSSRCSGRSSSHGSPRLLLGWQRNRPGSPRVDGRPAPLGRRLAPRAIPIHPRARHRRRSKRLPHQRPRPRSPAPRLSNFAILILAGAIGPDRPAPAAWVYHRNGVSLVAWPDLKGSVDSTHFAGLIALEWHTA